MATVQTVNVLLCCGPVLDLVYKTEFQILLILHQSKAVENEGEKRKGRREAWEPWQQCSHNSYGSASGRDATQQKKERELEKYICHTIFGLRRKKLSGKVF